MIKLKNSHENSKQTNQTEIVELLSEMFILCLCLCLCLCRVIHLLYESTDDNFAFS